MNADGHDDEQDQAHRGSGRAGVGAVARPVRRQRGHLEIGPAVAPRGDGEDRHRAAERRHQAGRQELLELVGRPADARPDEQRAA